MAFLWRRHEHFLDQAGQGRPADVKTGEVLLKLDEAMSQASFESIRQNYMAQRAAEGRLIAELFDNSSRA